VLSLWFPTLSTDLVRRRLTRNPQPPSATPPDTIILTRAVAARELVARCCARATIAGIREGMDLAQARSMLPDRAILHAEPHAPDRDAAALHALAVWALRFTPLSAPDSPDGLLLDISGTERIHTSEPRLLRSIASGARRRGLCIRIAAASTFAAAHAVARYARGLARERLFRIPPGRERDALAHLPIPALNLDHITAIALSEVGITRIGEVIDLPRPALASRFGLALLDRLDKALGRTSEHIDPVRPAPPLKASMLFDGATDHWESIETAARKVLEDLTTQLTTQQRGVRRLDIELMRPRFAPSPAQAGEVSERSDDGGGLPSLGTRHSALSTSPLLLSRPSRNPRHIWTLLRTQLERTDLQSGIEGIILTATRTARLRHQQLTALALGAPGLTDDDATDTAWGELVDTLISRLGPENIRRIEARESHIPERAIDNRQVLGDGDVSGSSKPRRSSLEIFTAEMSDSEISNSEISNFKLPLPSLPRPSLLLPSPEPIHALALTPDGPLLSLTWRGQHFRILSCIGPERISPEWWRWRSGREPPDRDYFAAQTDSGRWLWVCRQLNAGRWFIHGEWC
jgi:protein ImuB